VAAIDTSRRHGNLSSAIRLFVLDHFQARTDGSADVGHNGDRPAVAAQQAEANRPPRGVALERV
jgi:predicted DNA-binding ribbon-helix-helix protein